MTGLVFLPDGDLVATGEDAPFLVAGGAVQAYGDHADELSALCASGVTGGPGAVAGGEPVPAGVAQAGARRLATVVEWITRIWVAAEFLSAGSAWAP
jgi:hypothetical protein